MANPNTHTVYTIGHSNRTLEEFLAMLRYFNIALVADIRRYPGSKKYPQFNQQHLEIALSAAGIGYRHFVALGGRRRASKESKNTVWQHPSFRGYADYMETLEFSQAYHQLTDLAMKDPTVIMCSEAVWWHCHRSMVADQLKADGWEVMHIMNLGIVKEHPYTAPAKIIKGKLSYH